MKFHLTIPCYLETGRLWCDQSSNQMRNCYFFGWGDESGRIMVLIRFKLVFNVAWLGKKKKKKFSSHLLFSFEYLMKKQNKRSTFILVSPIISWPLEVLSSRTNQITVSNVFRSHFCAQDLAHVVTNLAETCRFPPGPEGRSMVNWSRVNWSTTLQAGEEGTPQCRWLEGWRDEG